MIALQAIINVLTGISALIAYMVYLLIDDRTQNNTSKDLEIKRKWHIAGGFLHVWCAYMVYQVSGLYWANLMLAFLWFFFDGFVNTYVLKKEWWYIGTTAAMDNIQFRVAKFLRIDERLLSAIIKNLYLIASIYLVIKFGL